MHVAGLGLSSMTIGGDARTLVIHLTIELTPVW